MTKKVRVLYVDHAGHPAPLSVCYHPTASRRIASSVNRYPPSTQVEIDSAFCPQCFSSYDVASAASLINCPKPTCRKCPVCTAVASVTCKSQECFYQCGFCQWTSQECDLVVSIENSADDNQVVKAAQQLGEALEEKIKVSEKLAEEHFQDMVGAWKKIVDDELKDQRYESMNLKRGRVKKASLGWSIEALEESVQQKKEAATKDSREVVGGHALKRLSLTDEPSEDLSNALEPQSVVLQTMTTAAIPRSRADLLPLPIPLRPRKSRRCRAELADGRPGILVRPKLNPLEGDSSQRTGHGQWWKKDSSAIHVIPSVRVVRFGSDSEKQRHAFLLEVKNPTLGMVKLRLAQSNYKGEPEWDAQGNVQQLEDLLIDVIESTRINALLDDAATNDLSPTNLVELERARDAFLELGKSQTALSDEVEHWKATFSDDTQSAVRHVATDKDIAWFELVTKSTPKKGFQFAVPLSLEVQIGDGSWESSLIQPAPGNETDFVRIDLVVTWPFS